MNTHKINCQCCSCKARRGEYKGENHPKFIKGITKEFLIEEYTKNKKFLRQISKELGCGKTLIYNRLKKYNIKINKKGRIKIKCAICKKVCEKIPYEMKRSKIHLCSDNCRKIYASLRMRSKHNPMKNKNIRTKHNNQLRGKKRPEHSKRMLGNKNPKFGKRLTPNWVKYKKIWFRSNWELWFAQFLSLSGINWQYESKTFNLGNSTYTPDFYIPEWDLYIEIKGYFPDCVKKKIKLFQNLYSLINFEILTKKRLEDLLCI